MSWEKIIELLHNGESDTVEFKKTVSNSLELAQDMTAFANSRGGYIVLGIDDKNGHLVGETISKEWILSVAKNKCEPKLSPNVTVIEKGGKQIILIYIYEGSSKPYYVENTCFIRDNIQTRPANNDEEQIMSYNKTESSASLNKRQSAALQHVQETGSITNKVYRELYNVSHKTAHIELTDMVKDQLLVIKGKGRSTCYIPSQPI